jgi:hypothetical protein
VVFNCPQTLSITRCAFEAELSGMPALNYHLMFQEMLNKTNGKVNPVIYWPSSRLARPHFTSNPDALYIDEPERAVFD